MVVIIRGNESQQFCIDIDYCSNLTMLALFQVIKRRFVADEITATERLRQF